MQNNTSYRSLIKACLRGNRQAQFELYQQHKVFLFGVCLRYAKNRAEAEDILQEGFFKILRDLKQYQPDKSLKGWMRKVMVNTALMHLRKHHKMSFDSLDNLPTESPAFADYSLLEYDRANAVIKMIQYLPVVQQTVFNLRAIEGYSFKEIAEQLGTNEATLRSHYLRARKRLQDLLQKEFNNG